MDKNQLHYKAMSDPTRRKIMDLLKEKTLTAGEIAEICGKSQPNISHHLNVLKESGLVDSEKRGMYVHYSSTEDAPEEEEPNWDVSFGFKTKLFASMKLLTERMGCSMTIEDESDDIGSVHVFKGTKRVLAVGYVFMLHSFDAHFHLLATGTVTPLQIPYNEASFDRLLTLLREQLKGVIEAEQKAEKEKQTLQGRLLHSVRMRLPLDIKEIFLTTDEQKRKTIRAIITEVLELEQSVALEEQEAYTTWLMDHLLGLGILHPFFLDDQVTEIMVTGTAPVYIAKGETIERTDVQFEGEELLAYIDQLTQYLGVVFNDCHPSVTVRLPNRSTLLFIHDVISPKGMSLTIVKHKKERLTLEDMVKKQCLSPDMSLFLQRAVRSKANILIVGGTGEGKTKLLNELGNVIGAEERFAVIEDMQELEFDRPHAVHLLTRWGAGEEAGNFTIRDCLLAAKGMRVDRVLVGELRREGVHMFLQMARDRYHGSMSTLHGQSVQSALSRLGSQVRQEEDAFTNQDAAELVADAVDLVVRVENFRDGGKKITEITEVVGYCPHERRYELTPLFLWGAESIETGAAQHFYTGESVSDSFADKLDRNGFPTFIELEKEGDQGIEYIQKIEDQLPDACLQLADGLRAGYDLHGVLEVVCKYGEKPLADELFFCKEAMHCGKSLSVALADLYQRVPSQEIALFIGVMQIQHEIGTRLELGLRQLASTLQSRNEIKRMIPLYKRKEELASPFWQVMDFVDMLSMTPLVELGLEGAMTSVCDKQDTYIAEACRRFVADVQQGKRKEDALKELGERMYVPEWKAFVNQMIQSDIFGTYLEQVLRTESNKLHTRAKMTAELKYKKRR